MLDVITWVDFALNSDGIGRYRVTQPAYGDPTHWMDTDSDMLAIAWAECQNIYNLPDDYPFFVVPDAVQWAKVIECCGTNMYRYGALMTPDNDGFIEPNTGQIRLTRDMRDGAWLMDRDGTPKVNIQRAQPVHQDKIRIQLAHDKRGNNENWQKGFEHWMREESPAARADFLRIIDDAQAVEDDALDVDLSGATTAMELFGLWPRGLARPPNPLRRRRA